MARKTKTPPPVSAVDVNALGVAGEPGKSKQPPGRARGCLKWAMLLLVGACGFSYLVSPPKAPTATPTAAAIATEVVSAEQVAAAATVIPTDIPPSVTVAPSATITDTPTLAMTAMAVVAVPTKMSDVSAPTAAIAASTVPTEFSEEIYVREISDTLFVGAGGRDVTSVRVADGRANGGERAVIVSYNTTESTPDAYVEEVLDLYEAIGVSIDTNNLDVDSVSLIMGINNQAALIMVADADDVVARGMGKMIREDFIAAVQTTNLTDSGASSNASSSGETAVMAVDSRTYYSDGAVRVRSCASRDCDVVLSLAAGDAVTVNGMIDGDEVNTGNKIWYRIQVGGKTGYVYSDLVSTVKPAAPTGGGVVTNNNQSVVPVPQSVPTANSGFVCPSNCTEAKAMGVSAQQAASCGLDRDGDGVACYGD